MPKFYQSNALNNFSFYYFLFLFYFVFLLIESVIYYVVLIYSGGDVYGCEYRYKFGI